MAITTYAELQTAIQNFMDDTSTITAARAQEAIALAEGDINLRLASLDITPTEARTTLSITGEYVATSGVSSSLVDIRSFEVSWTDSGNTYTQRLKNSSPDGIAILTDRGITDPEEYVVSGGELPPEYYAWQGSQFRFFPPPEGATYTNTYTGTIVYTTRLPALSELNTSNWLLTAFPNIYLSGALAWSEIYGWNKDTAADWKALFEQGMAMLEMAYPKRKDETPLRHDLPLRHYRRWDRW